MDHKERQGVIQESGKGAWIIVWDDGETQLYDYKNGNTVFIVETKTLSKVLEKRELNRKLDLEESIEQSFRIS